MKRICTQASSNRVGWGSQRRSFSNKSTYKQNLSLTVWGENLPSTVGSGRFTQKERNMIKLPPFQYSVIVGLLLSDGWINIGNDCKNGRLGLEQSTLYIEFLWETFYFLSRAQPTRSPSYGRPRSLL